MPEPLDHYRVLGVSPTATETEIKRAYRQRVRTYHPDASVDKVAAEKKFIRIVEAYQTLSAPLERALYDQRLLERKHRQHAARKQQFEESFRAQTLDSLLTTAEICYLRGDPNAARARCLELLERDPEHAPTYAFLGDLYLEQREFDQALAMYSYAVQYAPESVAYQRKLEQAAARRAPETEDTGPLDLATPEPERVGLPGYCAAAVAVFALAAGGWYVRMVSQSAGSDALLLGYVPKAPLCVGPILGAALGAAMVLLLWLRPFDDDFYAVTVTGASSFGSVPVGLYLAVLSAVSYYLAALFYLLLSLIEEEVSWSMVRAFAGVLAVVALLAIADWPHRNAILLLAGNTTFLGFLLGWGFGSMGRRPW